MIKKVQLLQIRLKNEESPLFPILFKAKKKQQAAYSKHKKKQRKKETTYAGGVGDDLKNKI